MKIIDLLNKIANEEEVPNKIKWGVHNYTWFVYDYKALMDAKERYEENIEDLLQENYIIQIQDINYDLNNLI